MSEQPTPSAQTRNVITTVANRLNRTPRATLTTTDLRIHIGETVHDEHPGTHPDDLIPKVRTVLPELAAGTTCGQYAAQLRQIAKGL